jgi:sugar lactone lactonase YvrE
MFVLINLVVPHMAGRPAWSKVHAKIDEGPDGKIYFSCTLNAGDRAKLPTYHWDDELPGGQLYQYDPATGQTRVFANLPPRRCTATSLLDHQRNIWWCNLEAGDGNALLGLDLATRQPIFQAPDGTTGFNRAMALARDGSIYFNGPERLMKLDFSSRRIVPTQTSFEASPGMRCATGETADGCIFGITQQTHQLFRYELASDKLTLLGPCFLNGAYTTVIALSPDEKHLYYLPGAHGKAYESGTPLVRYELATGERRVLAFLAPFCERRFGYVPAGTYGMKLSADGRTVYVNFNGHLSDASRRPQHLRPNGFGLTSFAAIHLPAE